MLKKLIKKYSLAICCVLCLASCAKEIDFDQADDIDLSPVFESSLIHFSLPANNFDDNGTEVNEVSDYIDINISGNRYFRDNLLKAEFVFEVLNSIDRSFELQIEFLNSANNELHTISFPISPSPNNTDVLTRYTELVEENSLRRIRRTVRLKFTLKMLTGTEINSSTPGRINLQSKGVFFIYDPE